MSKWEHRSVYRLKQQLGSYFRGARRDRKRIAELETEALNLQGEVERLTGLVDLRVSEADERIKELEAERDTAQGDVAYHKECTAHQYVRYTEAKAELASMTTALEEEVYHRNRAEAKRDAALEVCRDIVERHDHPGCSRTDHKIYEAALTALPATEKGR